MPQKSLYEYTSSEFASKDAVKPTLETVQNLAIPTPESRYCQPHKWATLSETSSTATLKAVYEELEDARRKRGLAACVAKQTDEREWKNKAFNFERQSENVSDSFVEVVKGHTFGTLDNLPVGTAALLSIWIPRIELYVKPEYYRKSNGYYDPDSYHIEIARDDAWDWYDEYNSSDGSYEKSTTVHEIGHALQYLAGITIENESLDNRDYPKDEWRLELVQEGPVAPWQMRFREAGVTAFRKLQAEEYKYIDGFTKYQTKNLEEVYACSFTAYITSEAYLKAEQPILHTAYNSLC